MDEKKIATEIENIFKGDRLGEAEVSMKMLLAIGNLMTPLEGDKFMDEHPDLLKFGPLASNLYATYIVNSENSASRKLLGSSAKNIHFSQSVSGFGKEAYERVMDMFEIVDFRLCQCFVLVGCGSFPVTIFHVFDRVNVPNIVGLDDRHDATRLFQQVIDKYQLNGMRSVNCSGQEYDFSDAGVIYIANLVSPKKDVLNRIWETAPDNAQIIVREPYSIGRLWTEKGTDDLCDKFEVVAYGDYGPAYYSRDVILKKL